MKSFIKNTITMLLVALIIGAMPTDAEGEIYNDTLRLHILAASDSREDQALKLEIRDRLLCEYGEILKGCDSLGEAEAMTQNLLCKIEESVNLWIREMGYGYSASAQLGREWYDTREYDGFTLPAGQYLSLRVIIGGGEGKNWWCIMYPPLCLDIATESAPADDGVIDYTEEEIRLISGGKYQIKFKILEELSRAFEKNG